MGMVERGEVGAVSIGYKVTEWDIEDASGNSVDPEDMLWDDDLTFIASQWELLEASLVCVPADNLATIRSLGRNDFISDIRARMYARQKVTDIRARMMSRQAMYDRQSEMLGNYDD
jgi:phage head maturation protease